MSWIEQMTHEASKTAIGAIVGAVILGIGAMWRMGATNSVKLKLFEQELAHRERIREVESASIDKRFAALELSVTTLQTQMTCAQTAIMHKLDQIEKEIIE